ncbi:MAG: excinuclease ABC subunit UvrB [Planctomycetota bacterium]|nr:excinuclease ABC subunit UvrB [Planctomycetota bacterium]
MVANNFNLASPFLPAGDQPAAIETLVSRFAAKNSRQTLLGVTGSGKTFTVANLIQNLQVPTLVLAHNKTLASQLYQELRELFPDNAVEYFVSYYDYYQPEAYIPSSDTYIEKDARINERIERLRNSTTASLLTRRDVIVVASVSCIYGLGDPETYQNLALRLVVGGDCLRQQLLRELVRTQHSRNEVGFGAGTFRVRGNAVEVWPIHEESRFLRIELDDGKISELMYVDSLTGEILETPHNVAVYPVGHYVQPEDKIPQALVSMRAECSTRVAELNRLGKNLEASRLERRVLSDIEDLEELGYCVGIENYSSLFEQRADGQPPFTLLNYFPSDFLTVIDESHVTLPQVYSMVRGDAARKESLIEHGFRLPSALNNRPLAEPEFEGMMSRVLYVSATPSHRERALAGDDYVEQIVRPTGLLEPIIEVRSAKHQVEECLAEVLKCVKLQQRVLVTTLTKRSSEDLTEFLQENRVKASYMHADIDTMQRSELLRDLRLGVIDVLVGINLLREGLDIPEVSLVLILDADREGFLRSTTSLVQTCGRAARNVDGRVIMFGDKMTKSMQEAIDESQRRRDIQHAFNVANGITPRTISKPVIDSLSGILLRESDEQQVDYQAIDWQQQGDELREQMQSAAADLKFELAIELRDKLQRLETQRLSHDE